MHTYTSNHKFYNFPIENTILKASSLENCQVTLTCNHHDRNDVVFNPKSTFWRKNNGSFVEYSEGVVKSGNEVTILYITAEYGDTFTCALKLQNGGLEESNTIQFKDLMKFLNVRLILYIESSEITYIHTCTVHTYDLRTYKVLYIMHSLYNISVCIYVYNTI